MLLGRWGRYTAPGGTIPYTVYRPSIYDIQGAHAPLRPRKTQRDKVLAAIQVGLYVPLNPPPTPCSKRQLKRVGGE